MIELQPSDISLRNIEVRGIDRSLTLMNFFKVLTELLYVLGERQPVQCYTRVFFAETRLSLRLVSFSGQEKEGDRQ